MGDYAELGYKEEKSTALLQQTLNDNKNITDNSSGKII